MAARGPRVRGAAPEAVRRDRGDGAAGARGARRVPRSRCSKRCAPVSTQLQIERRRTRPAEALLVDLREDGRPRQGVRRDQRPRRRARHRRLGQGLLRRAGLDPRALAARPGPLQGLRRDAQVQPLPVVAHDGGRARGRARSSSRSARPRCTAGPSSASPRTSATRSTATRPKTSSGSSGSSTGNRTRPIPASSCRA